MTVTTVARRDTRLLIANGDRFAVIEQRDDPLYGCHDDERASIRRMSCQTSGGLLNDGD